jgi:hypothetical protein
MKAHLRLSAEEVETVRHALANYIVELKHSTDGVSLPPNATKPIDDMRVRAVMVLNDLNRAERDASQ